LQNQFLCHFKWVDKNGNKAATGTIFVLLFMVSNVSIKREIKLKAQMNLIQVTL